MIHPEFHKYEMGLNRIIYNFPSCYVLPRLGREVIRGATKSL